jgi:hypothetical protein
MKCLSTKALTTKCLRTKALSLQYPTYERLAVQRVLVPAFSSIMMGVGNLSSLGLDALHGSGSISLMTAHIVTHVVLVVPAGRLKGTC